MQIIAPLTIFVLVALAAKDIGKWFRYAGLPLISGFLFVGVLVGPYVLGLFDQQSVESMGFVNAIALSFIAFAAGSELHLDQLRGTWRSILFIIGGLVVAVLTFGVIGYVLLADAIPFMQGMTTVEVLAVALVGAVIMVARSPSSAYAIIKELRARGPFTKRIFGATVLMDSLVIVLFAIAISVADVLIEGASFNPPIFFHIILEIALDIFFGILVGQILRLILSLKLDRRLKTVLILAVGYGIFFLADALRLVHLAGQPVELFAEPLLVALVAGFVVSNYTRYGPEFSKIVEEISPVIFILFFILVGVNINLGVLGQTWSIILALFTIRLLGIIVGSFSGGVLAGDPMRHNRLLWLTFITQAGVSIGLAQEVANEFPAWGADFASLAIAVIVLNQIVGPPAFKWVIKRVGEAHPKADPNTFDGTRDVLIFGMGARALTLAKRLAQHQWSVRMVCLNRNFFVKIQGEEEIDARYVTSLGVDILADLEADNADAVVAMLPEDDQNYEVCELAYEHIGTDRIVAFVRDPSQISRFRELGVSVVEQTTAIVSLLEEFVRSPATTSLLLGESDSQDVMELMVIDRGVDGVAIRDLHLPSDILILSIRRNGTILVTHGYSRLKIGDKVTVLGTPDSIQAVDMRFAGYQIPVMQTP